MLHGNTPEVFLDADVALDIISRREPHFKGSIQILDLVKKGEIKVLVSEISLANLVYLTFEGYKLKDGAYRLSEFIKLCDVVRSGKNVILEALDSSFKDKEDAIQYFTAKQTNADGFITRNIRDYKKHMLPTLPIYTPTEFAEQL